MTKRSFHWLFACILRARRQNVGPMKGLFSFEAPARCFCLRDGLDVLEGRQPAKEKHDQ